MYKIGQKSVGDGREVKRPAFLQRFGGRLTIAILSAHIVISLLVFGVTVATMRRITQAGFVEQITASSQRVAVQIGTIHLQQNSNELAGLLTNSMIGGNIRYASVVDKKGVVIYSSRGKDDSGFKQDQMFAVGGDSVYYISVPIFTLAGLPDGVLRLGYDEKWLQAELAQITNYAILLALVYIVLLAPVIVLISSRFTRSLKKLKYAAHEVIRDPGHRVDITTDISEIRDLALDMEHMRQQLLLRQQSVVDKALYARNIVDNVADAMVAFDVEGRIRDANKVMARMFGLVGSDVRDMPITRFINQTLEELIAGSKPDTSGQQGAHAWWLYEARGIRRNKQTFPVEVAITCRWVMGEMLYMLLIRDISERKKTETKLQRSANYDALTDLPNRNLFRDRLDHALLMSKRFNTLVAVLFIDLDHFKKVNDTLGHAAGDKLLQLVAQRLTQTLRRSDTLARLGGDEFVIILEILKSVHFSASVAKRAIAALQKPFMINEQEVHVSPSIGISVFPFGEQSADDLVVEADVAMYRAKQHGRNTFEFYTQDMNTRSLHRLNMESALHYALQQQEYVLHFQPQMDFTTNRITGFEALLRWNNRFKGLMLPNEFIDVLEETGLIIDVGEWVIEETCRQLSEWRDQLQLDSELRVTINLSPSQFEKDNLPEVIEQNIKKYNLPASKLGLEITEGAFRRDADVIIRRLKELRKMGISIVLDDVGAGHSSLVQLKAYPIDMIKIDGSIIQDLVQDRGSQAIVRAVIALARTLDIEVIAEGVETLAQQQLLKSFECYHMQGFLIAPPLPVDDVVSFLNHVMAS